MPTRLLCGLKYVCEVESVAKTGWVLDSDSKQSVMFVWRIIYHSISSIGKIVRQHKQ